MLPLHPQPIGFLSLRLALKEPIRFGLTELESELAEHCVLLELVVFFPPIQSFQAVRFIVKHAKRRFKQMAIRLDLLLLRLSNESGF